MADPLNFDSGKLAEVAQGGMTARDLSDTHEEMYRIREEMGRMFQDLTLDEMRECAGMVRDWYNS